MALTAVMASSGLRSLLLGALCASTLFVSPAQAHMELEIPPPWDSPDAANAADRNYNIKSPLQSDGSDFPCQGLNNASDTPKSTTTYQAGQTYKTTIEGYAAHNGGSCQLSLSYDEGKTWKVIKSIIGGCPTQGSASYDFTIPTTAPSGTALFAWTWINHTGNREFYMNCAVVDIEGQSGGDLCALPNLYVANLAGINDCTSPEGVDPMYPDPGENVVYANGMSASSPVTGDSSCEMPAPQCGGSGDGDKPQKSSTETSQIESTSSTSTIASSSSTSAKALTSSTSTTSSSSTSAKASTSSTSAKASMSSTSAKSGAQVTGFALAAMASGVTDAPGFTSLVEAYIASVLGASAAAATGAQGASLTSMVESYINSVLHRSTPFPTNTASRTDSSSTITAFSATRTITSTGTTTLTRNTTAVTSDGRLIESFIQSLLTGSSTPRPLPNANTRLAPHRNATASSASQNIFPEAAVNGRLQCSATSCPPRPVVTQTVTAESPASTCSAPVVQCDCSAGEYCAPVNACTTKCVGSGSTMRTVVTSSSSSSSSNSSGESSSTPITRLLTHQPPAPPSSSPSSSSPHPPYVPTNPNTPSYLPCTPGAFLCASPTTFYTCNQPAPPNTPNTSNGWAWSTPARPVADGMMCLPLKRAANSTETDHPGAYGPRASNGTAVRDDRYVRARPDGDCAVEGALRCTDGGGGFGVCVQGGWVDGGAVAGGTECRDGGIVRVG